MASGEERIRQAAESAASKYAGKDVFGHGFLWVRTRRGNKFVAAYLSACSNHGKIIEAVQQETGVEAAWVNLD